MLENFFIPKWRFLRHNIPIMIWILLAVGMFFASPGMSAEAEAENPFDTYPYLKSLFSQEERKDIQVYLGKEYHTQKRQKEIREGARQFFKNLMRFEYQRALGERENFRTQFGLEVENERRGHPYQELLELLENST